jgi:hypothetical protein
MFAEVHLNETLPAAAYRRLEQTVLVINFMRLR